jgi:cystathionine beta-lyase/cystathionine gamma-synthase
MKEREVKTMEIVEKQSNRSAQSWTKRSEHRRSTEADFYPELRSWVQHAIVEAEKSKNSEKKDQLLSLLKEL